MITHVDDVDVIGESKEGLTRILERVKTLWPVKEVPAGFMLGMKRETFVKDGVTYVKLSQGACVEEHYEKFKKYMPKKIPNLPMRPGSTFNKSNAAKTDEEAKRVIELGYQKLCGACLWIARGTVPESLFAVSQCCSLMARPSTEAWEVLCGILAYQKSKAGERGIVFRSDGNTEPIVLCDAAFKPNPYTGKSTYGIVAMIYGGPGVTISKTLNHVGLSTPHVEMMALNQGARVVSWLRNLFLEIGRPLRNKTPLVSDSSVGVHITREQIVSEKNKFVQIAYHYIDEMSGELEVHFERSKEMLADVFTKNVVPGIFEYLTPKLTGTANCPYKFVPPKFKPPGMSVGGESLN